MRLFGSDRLSGSAETRDAGRRAHREQHGFRAIENAQKRVEGHRTKSVRPCWTMTTSNQAARTVIYSLRRDLMQEPDLEPILNEYLSDLLDDMYAARSFQGRTRHRR
ncbi:MAG: hypothetical protein ACLR0N_04030 [Bilophila wadsworthia]